MHEGSDGFDRDHGPRAAKYAKKLRAHIPLNDDQFNDLCMACKSHTFGHGRALNKTIATCWDADRLDIGRVGVLPHSDYLINQEAKRIADDRDMKVLHDFKCLSLLDGYELAH